jgi:hypothetical protein
MLFVVEISWKPEKSDEFWKRVAERKVPQSEGARVDVNKSYICDDLF